MGIIDFEERGSLSEANPIVILKAKIKEFGFSNLKAGESNESANSGETIYFDFPRMNFVINGKIIDKYSFNLCINGRSSISQKQPF